MRLPIYLLASLSLVSYSDCTVKTEQPEAGLSLSQSQSPHLLSTISLKPSPTTRDGIEKDSDAGISGAAGFQKIRTLIRTSLGIQTDPEKSNASIPICKQRDSKSLNECLRGVLEEIRPRIGQGIPEVGLPGMDPLHIPHLSFEHGSGPIKIMAQFSDVEVTGLSKFNNSDFWVDVEKRTLDFDVSFPHTLLAGTYQLTGNLFFVPVAGNGHFWLNLGGVSSKGSGKLSSRTNGTSKRVVVDQTKVDLNIESIKVHLTDLFNGDRLLGSVINNFLNENSNEIFEELRPQIGSRVGEMLTMIGNRALSALPPDYFDGQPVQQKQPIMT